VGQVEAQLGKLRQRLASVGAVVAVVSGKGGVGKSTLAANLACGLALDGWSVGVLDADLNGPTQAKVLGVRGPAAGRDRRRRRAAARRPRRQGDVHGPAAGRGRHTAHVGRAVQDEAHTWRGTVEANAIREFPRRHDWGTLDALVLDLPPGTDRS